MMDAALKDRMSAAVPGVGVWLCYLDDDRDIALEPAWRRLSQQEVLRAERFHFARDRDRFVRGRSFMRQTLGAWTGGSAAQLRLDLGPYDKPFLAGGPHFNLSHSGPFAALAISPHAPVGIDIEFDDRDMAISDIAESCFCGDELAPLQTLPASAARRYFFACWTAKEALMKMTGEGMARPPLTIALRLEAGWPTGYLRPQEPAALLHYIDTKIDGLTCCIACAAGA